MDPFSSSPPRIYPCLGYIFFHSEFTLLEDSPIEEVVPAAVEIITYELIQELDSVFPVGQVACLLLHLGHLELTTPDNRFLCDLSEERDLYGQVQRYVDAIPREQVHSLSYHVTLVVRFT